MGAVRVRGDGAERVVRLGGARVRVGRAEDNELVLGCERVSKRHARLERDGEGWWVEDAGSTNGTWLNGRRLEAPVRLRPGDELALGGCVLALEDAPADAGVPLVRALHERLVAHLDLRRLAVERLGDGELRGRAEAAARELVEGMRERGELPADTDLPALARAVLDEALGLGPLEALLADPGVSEIMVNHARQIYVERAGRLELTPLGFSSDAALLGAIERIVARVGRRIDEASPLVDARLPDGSRVNAIIPPLALKGPCLTIRRFRAAPLAMEDLVRLGTLSAPMARFLELCVRARRNVVVSGGTGSGKTTTLNVLSAAIPAGERVVTIEDAAELRLAQPHWVALEGRPPNVEGRGAVTLRDLVRNSLRMRPDRLVVGECRGGEALDMLQAMNTGHDGSLTTLHANGPREALARLETLVLMSGVELPVRAIREQIAQAVHVLVHQARGADGTRRVTAIAEVAGLEGDRLTLQEVFGWARGPDGVGRFCASGFVPRVCEALREGGEPVDLTLFRREEDGS